MLPCAQTHLPWHICRRSRIASLAQGVFSWLLEISARSEKIQPAKHRPREHLLPSALMVASKTECLVASCLFFTRGPVRGPGESLRQNYSEKQKQMTGYAWGLTLGKVGFLKWEPNKFAPSSPQIRLLKINHRDFCIFLVCLLLLWRIIQLIICNQGLWVLLVFAFALCFATCPGVCFRIWHLLIIEAFVFSRPTPVLLALAFCGIGETLFHRERVVHVVALVRALVQGFFSGADFQGAVPDAIPKINEHTCGGWRGGTGEYSVALAPTGLGGRPLSTVKAELVVSGLSLVYTVFGKYLN